MLRTKILNRLAYSIIILAIVNFIAVRFSWYGLVWWFDMPMHFLGGMSVFYIGALFWLPARKWVRDGRFIYEGIITALLLGVLWEGLELYLFMQYGTPNFFLVDSLSDVCFDLAGAFLAAFMLAPHLFS